MIHPNTLHLDVEEVISHGVLVFMSEGKCKLISVKWIGLKSHREQCKWIGIQVWKIPCYSR